MFALDSFCLHHKLCKRNFLFSKYRKLEFSHLFAYVDTVSQISLLNFVSFDESSRVLVRNFARTKDESRRTSLSFLLHSTVPALLLYSQHFLFKEWNEIPLKVRNSESIGSFRNPVLYLLAKNLVGTM